MGRRFIVRRKRVLYHVMSRTAQQVHWLQDPRYKKMFLDYLHALSEVFFVEIISEAFLGNHYHILLRFDCLDFDLEDIMRRFGLAESMRTGNYRRKWQDHMAEGLYQRYTSLSWFMWYFNQGTARMHNKVAGTKGHLWGSRFKSVVVEEGEAELAVATYIEMNAVRAGIVEDPTTYPYCSVGALNLKLEAGEEAKAPDLSILSQLEAKIRALTYRDWMRYVALTLIDPDLKQGSLPRLFTDKGWVIDMKSLHEALMTKAPANWSTPVYGSKKFVRETMAAAERMIPLHGRDKPPPDEVPAVA